MYVNYIHRGDSYLFMKCNKLPRPTFVLMYYSAISDGNCIFRLIISLFRTLIKSSIVVIKKLYGVFCHFRKKQKQAGLPLLQSYSNSGGVLVTLGEESLSRA